VIFVVLAVAWAVYLIPMALRHHDEVARTRSIDRFSNAMRVLARREPVNRRDARLVVTPARAADNPRVLAPSAKPAPAAAALRPQAVRAAARAAARRRRRILILLLLADAVVVGLAAFAIVPRRSAAIPAAITLLYLVLCRTQVRRERHATWDRALAEAAEAEPEADLEVGPLEIDPNEDTMAIPVAVLDAVAVPTEDGGSLWDPLPVTLPTYVGKPAARRTVRTIDLSEPGTWTSGRSEEDSQLVAESAAAAAEQSAEAEEQRAVGS
jgi:hypothetical protein